MTIEKKPATDKSPVAASRPAAADASRAAARKPGSVPEPVVTANGIPLAQSSPNPKASWPFPVARPA